MACADWPRHCKLLVRVCREVATLLRSHRHLEGRRSGTRRTAELRRCQDFLGLYEIRRMARPRRRRCRISIPSIVGSDPHRPSTRTSRGSVMADIARIEERLDRVAAGNTAVSDQLGGSVIQNMTEVMEFSKLMACAGNAVHKHLQGNPGMCLAVCVQALEWRFSPFAVANKGRGFSQQHVESASRGGVIETASEPDSNSSLAHPPAETDTPATSDHPPALVAGTNSELPDEALGGNGNSEAGARNDDCSAASDTLPDGWDVAYVAALKRAQKKESLSKYATQFWDRYGGWNVHKDGSTGQQAAAFFDAFNNNFGYKDAIDAELREVLA